MKSEMHSYKVSFTFSLYRTFNIDIKTVQVVVDAESKKEAKIIATGLLSEIAQGKIKSIKIQQL